MSVLTSPLRLRDLTLRNRLIMSPMCQYSAQDGHPNDWHIVHYGARAQGGAGMVMLESTAISPDARISAGCLGLWDESQVHSHAALVKAIHRHGAAAAVQLNHAGAKASFTAPWEGNRPLPLEEGGWARLAPSARLAKAPTTSITEAQIRDVIRDFEKAACLAVKAGFDAIEVHAAHGYLLHQFLSPLSNEREDHYGGDTLARSQFLLDVVRAVRAVIPVSMPLFVRLSCVDARGSDEGWRLEESIELSHQLAKLGVDIIDCTSGGVSTFTPSREGAFNAELSRALKTATPLAIGTVGGVNTPEQAENLLEQGQCDVVFVGRALLRDPYWLLRIESAKQAGWVPVQYARAEF
jgi:2,4-dienoyl-CoA reductase-like NADH-dependent reductase (Old Yellow Enzyme family)